jgi:hypothetical protein
LLWMLLFAINWVLLKSEVNISKLGREISYYHRLIRKLS